MTSVPRMSRWGVAAVATLASLSALTVPGAADAKSAARLSDTKFSIAVIPDTQLEVLDASDERFIERTRWLAKNRKNLDLRFVTHVGDVVNWGWLDQSQYDIADEALGVLDRAALPYALTIGNHDTRAVDVGGSAYASNPECAERFGAAECSGFTLVRHTEEFNDTFPLSRMRNEQGAFESGRVDNSYSTFQGGGTHWLVLTLEMWPRSAVVDWASAVVAQHPDANVIVQTHQYLNADGSIGEFASAPGMTSPQYLYDQVIRRYPNVKLVLSGHNGQTADRIDTGDSGNRILSLLTAIHSTTTNPVRLMEFDTAAGTVRTWLHSSHTEETSASVTFGGLSFP